MCIRDSDTSIEMEELPVVEDPLLEDDELLPEPVIEDEIVEEIVDEPQDLDEEITMPTPLDDEPILVEDPMDLEETESPDDIPVE